MRSSIDIGMLCLSALLLGGCNKAPSDPPVPTVTPARVETGPAAGSVANTSVPPADSVITPANENKVDPAAGRSNRSMSRSQESSAMPMPGQNNDHSAPLSAKGASSP